MGSLKVGNQKESGVREINSTCGHKSSYVLRGSDGDRKPESQKWLAGTREIGNYENKRLKELSQ